MKFAMVRDRFTAGFREGLRFGMMLQFAVGPVCLFVLSTAVSTNFLNAFFSVIAVTLVDAAYIFLAVAGLGLAKKIHKNNMHFRVISGIIVFLFGLNIIFNAFGINLIPYFNNFGSRGNYHTFVYALILTASNPLTILFWTGVFGSKIREKKMSGSYMKWFGAGCVFSTFLFLTLVSLLGTLLHFTIPREAITILNMLVGMGLLALSLKVMFGHKTTA